MRRFLPLMCCLLVGACGLVKPGPSDDTRKLSDVLKRAEPDSRRIEISHYAKTEDDRRFCGLAVIDGRISMFRIEYINAGNAMQVLHTPSIDKASNKDGTSRMYMLRLMQIVDGCKEDGLSLRPS